jgi:hypothetical protein
MTPYPKPGAMFNGRIDNMELLLNKRPEVEGVLEP